jgi:hypothetical protein
LLAKNSGRLAKTGRSVNPKIHIPLAEIQPQGNFPYQFLYLAKKGFLNSSLSGSPAKEITFNLNHTMVCWFICLTV